MTSPAQTRGDVAGLGFPLVAEVGGFSAGEQADFQGAGNEAAVLQGGAGGLDGVEPLEFRHEVIERAGVEFGAEGRVAGGQRSGAVGEEFQIESGAAGDDRGFAAALDFLDDGFGEAHVAARIGGLRWDPVCRRDGGGRCDRSSNEGAALTISRPR